MEIAIRLLLLEEVTLFTTKVYFSAQRKIGDADYAITENGIKRLTGQ
jgi:hypothetical protein